MLSGACGAQRSRRPADGHQAGSELERLVMHAHHTAASTPTLKPHHLHRNGKLMIKSETVPKTQPDQIPMLRYPQIIRAMYSSPRLAPSGTLGNHKRFIAFEADSEYFGILAVMTTLPIPINPHELNIMFHGHLVHNARHHRWQNRSKAEVLASGGWPG